MRAASPSLQEPEMDGHRRGDIPSEAPCKAARSGPGAASCPPDRWVRQPEGRVGTRTRVRASPCLPDKARELRLACEQGTLPGPPV